ncbi:MAG: 50S ribosomal protein L9 [Syntrophales bacterium]|nr:50S ribosomal protein L9 [Syntrophales bacterium]
MKVILRKDVPGLGKTGDVVNVSDGYGRNFLFPRGLAAEATETAMSGIENIRKKSREKEEREKARAQQLLNKLNGTVCRIKRRVGEQNRMFGSVNTKDIEKILAEQGFSIDRKAVILEEPIRSLGTFPVRVRVMPGIFAEIRVVVEADQS